MKLIRKIAPGVNPDFEIGRFLTEKRFSHSAPTLGAIEFRMDQEEPSTIGILQGYIPNQGDAWKYTRDCLGDYIDRVMGHSLPLLPDPFAVNLLDTPPSDESIQCIGDYLESAQLLGRRTAEMHRCLAAEQNLPEFKSEAFSKIYQRALYQSMRTRLGKALPLLGRHFNRLPENLRIRAMEIIKREKEILNHFKKLLETKIGAVRIRCLDYLKRCFRILPASNRQASQNLSGSSSSLSRLLENPIRQSGV